MITTALTVDSSGPNPPSYAWDSILANDNNNDDYDYDDGNDNNFNDNDYNTMN